MGFYTPIRTFSLNAAFQTFINPFSRRGNMATRAIRYDQLNTDSARTASEGLVWTNYSHGDTENLHSLQVAVNHQIECAGETAADIEKRIGHIRQEQYACVNYFGVMTSVYAHLIPELINYELQNTTLPTLMRKKLKEMRDVVKAKTTNGYFDYRNDTDITDLRNEMTRAMSEFTRDFNDLYFGSMQTQVLSLGVNINSLEPDTTDAEIDEMVDIITGNYGSLWRINTWAFLNGGFNMRTTAHQYPSIPDDVMEIFMENLIENHPAIALRIAQNDQFFQDNPMAQSVGHSWTSRNRSNDCWFKIPHDQVNKKRTIVFAPPRNFFGKFTPTLSDMNDNLIQFKDDVTDFLKSAEPKIKDSVNAENVLADKTTESMQKAVIDLVQGLLDDKDTVDVGTAIIGHIAGIAHLPIDTSSFPNGYITYTYYDYTRKQDLNQPFYPQHMKDIVSLTDFNITNEVQQVLSTAYRENLETRRTIHANQCAHLARQIAQQTTRHDAEMKVITDAFTEYQTQV